MADTEKITREAVVKITLLNSDGTSTTTRTINMPNPKSLNALKEAARNFVEYYFGSEEVTPTTDETTMFQPSRWEDEYDVSDIYHTTGIEVSNVEKTETFFDFST